MPKVMEIIEKETKGKSYHTYKYSYDSIGLPSIDYDDDPNKVMKWKDSGETDSPKGAVDLKHLADQLQQLGETPLLKYFLDGSRHVFKVDDIAYNKQVFPVVAGQIGVGCCRRENKRMQKERFYRELVLALPDKANADGWDDAAYFAAKVKKLNESEELMRLGLHFSAILPYATSKAGSPGTKLENLAVGVIQDYMVEAEKRMVAELVRDKRLGQDAYLLKDGSLEYKIMKSGREDLRTLQKIKHNYSWVIGVSKSFNPESCLDHTGKPNSNYIANLPVFHRTPVARYENREFLGDVQFGVWYIRLRDKRRTQTPFDGVMIGGIMSSLLPTEVYEATGIEPFVGLLNHPGDIDEGNNLIIDELPLDYSILEEIDYVYPANNAYFAYMTRGCVNKCKFCAVPKLEPQYCDYINLRKRIQHTDERFGARKDLLLLDNNVLASKYYNQIINEIRDCGFGVGATYTPPNEYEIMINNLKDSYNDRAYIRKAISIYREIMAKLKDSAEKTELYLALETAHCLYYYTASKEDILGLDEYVRPLYEKTHKPSKRKRIVDFNQGIDSRLITEANMKKLSEVNIQPLRIAFDHWNLRDIYEKSVRIAVKSGIKSLSNYLLYNFEDKPEELYYRLRLNVDLCEELGASIYSFPMKYHPINDKEFFMNRDYIGKHWNRKFIRAVQAVLNSTKGKIGRGVDFFEEAFGRDIDEFIKILWMPETFIIYRRIYDADLRSRLSGKYTTVTMHDCDLANEWWEKFRSLPPQKLELAKSIIALNKFKSDDISCNDKEILEVLSYYTITRDEAEA